METVGTVPDLWTCWITGLKPGVNEKGLLRQADSQTRVCATRAAVNPIDHCAVFLINHPSLHF